MLVILGGIVGQASGRIGAIVASKNRYGAYMRNGTIPITSTTQWAMAAKARMTQITQAWQALGTDQQNAWSLWARLNPVRNRLGQSVTLTGHAAYVKINARLLFAGQALLDGPPLTAAPPPLTTFSVTGDAGAGAFGTVHTPTPLAADNALWLRVCLLDSLGIQYVENLLKLLPISAKAQASPYDFQANLIARIGALQIGQRMIVEASVFDTATGLLSEPLRSSVLITSS
jgi:hypothetical protein